MRKKYENKQDVFPTMKVNYDKAIQVNNEHKVNVDKQQVDMKHLKEQCDIDDEEKFQKTTVSRTPMKKIKSLCVSCYQTFAKKY